MMTIRTRTFANCIHCPNCNAMWEIREPVRFATTILPEEYPRRIQWRCSCRAYLSVVIKQPLNAIYSSTSVYP